MAKMTIADFESRDFYKVPKWILNVEGLQPGDILIYMLAYDNWRLSVKNGLIDRDGAVYFYLTHENIKEKLRFGKNQIIAGIKRLVASGLVIQEKSQGKANKFYFEKDVEMILTDENQYPKSDQSLKTDQYPKSDYTSHQNQTTLVTEIRLHQSEKSDISKNNKTRILSKNNKIRIKEKKDSVKDQLENEIISFELKEKLIDFINYRNEIKKPIKSYHSIQVLISQIGTKYADEQHLAESIDNSIANGWQGVFPTVTRQEKKVAIETETFTEAWLRQNGGR